MTAEHLADVVPIRLEPPTPRPELYKPPPDADEPRLERDRVRQRIATLKERLNQTTTGPTPAPTSESFSTPTQADQKPHSGAQAADA